MKMPLALHLLRDIHLCRSFSHVLHPPTFLKLIRNRQVLLTFCKVPTESLAPARGNGGCGAIWPDERGRVACRCGAQHMCKWNQKTLPSERPCKWRKADSTPKCTKNNACSDHFGTCDVEQVHAVVARSISQKFPFFSDSTHLCFSFVHSVGSLPFKLQGADILLRHRTIGNHMKPIILGMWGLLGRVVIGQFHIPAYLFHRGSTDQLCTYNGDIN